MATAAAVIGIGGAVVGTIQKNRALKKQAKAQQEIHQLNQDAAEQDIIHTMTQAAQQSRVIQQQRALASGQIESAAAASGVAATGSVQVALRMNAEQQAREQNMLRLEQEHAIKQIKLQAELASSANEAYQQQAKDQQFANWLSGTGAILQSGKELF